MNRLSWTLAAALMIAGPTAWADPAAADNDMQKMMTQCQQMSEQMAAKKTPEQTGQSKAGSAEDRQKMMLRCQEMDAEMGTQTDTAAPPKHKR